ncbi:zinc-dependent alcohol dehydrogenase family protein [Streptomyces sp. NPDC005336]|uniref:zinc-dependent alcohol dehydrogenase family protein n=1 Tax=Streptomyces sp. NPDC005336 TaxID=3157035 RepID=UPI0033B5FB4F
MMRAVRFYETGGPEVLKVEEAAVPEPGPGEVLVAIEAIGLNRAEANFRAGRYFEQPRVFPAGLGYEAAGTVLSLGPGVRDRRDLPEGTAVSVLPTFSMRDFHVYAEQAVVPASSLVPRPEGLGAVDGAAVWMPHLTAYGALGDLADVGEGDTVVITAASSSVGLAAIRTARRLGARSVAVTRTAAKRAALENTGADLVVVRQEQELTEEVGKLADGEGARVVFDPVGGPGAAELAACAAPGGTVFIYGSLGGQETFFPRVALAKGLSFRGYLVFEVFADPRRFVRATEFVLSGLADGSLEPAVDSTYELSRIVAAHRHLESNRQTGKVVVTVEGRAATPV